MESRYPQVKLGDVCKLRSGFPFKSADWTDSGEPVIKIANVKAGRIVPEGCAFVSPSVAKQAAEWYTQPGDILMAMTGYVGELAWVRPGERFLVNQRVGRFDNINCTKVHPRYLFYVLQHSDIRGLIETIARGSAQPNLSAGDAHGIEVPLPPIPIQESIAETLSILDDKITLLRETNATLEAIAQAIFKSWFVDFDPVRAKAEGREPEGVPPEVADLFPSEFEESELGAIPKGWRVGTLGDIADLVQGFAFKSKDWVADGVPVVKIGSVKPGVVDLSQVSYVTDDVARSAARFQLSPGDLLIGMTGYVGEVGLIPPTDRPPLLNQRVAKFVAIGGHNAMPFLYCFARRKEFKSQVEERSHGSAQANVSATGILSVPLLVPPDPIRTSFNELCDPLINRMLGGLGEIAYLADLRDTLLPRLMSGMLPVNAC